MILSILANARRPCILSVAKVRTTVSHASIFFALKIYRCKWILLEWFLGKKILMYLQLHHFWDTLHLQLKPLPASLSRWSSMSKPTIYPWLFWLLLIFNYVLNEQDKLNTARNFWFVSCQRFVYIVNWQNSKMW